MQNHFPCHLSLLMFTDQQQRHANFPLQPATIPYYSLPCSMHSVWLKRQQNRAQVPEKSGRKVIRHFSRLTTEHITENALFFPGPKNKRRRTAAERRSRGFWGSHGFGLSFQASGFECVKNESWAEFQSRQSEP